MSSEWISIAAVATHWLVVAGLFVRVISRRTPVGVSLGWLAVIASVPYFGAGMYLLIGEKRLGRQRAARVSACVEATRRWQSALRRHCGSGTATVPEIAEPIRRHAERVLGFAAMPGNAIELLDGFERMFDALVADIDAARTSCHLCFYIWHESGRAEDVIEALVRAARRGVRCLALADALGSKKFLSGAGRKRLREAGVELVAALPTGLLRTLFVRRDLRNHRKLVVIDDRVAYVGSQNLVDPRYFKRDAGVGEWIDGVARVTGPAAMALDVVFGSDWSIETGSPCESEFAGEDDVRGAAGGALAQVVPSGPDRMPKAIHQLLLMAIYAARRELVMTTPYFVPDESILTALLSAAFRGVDVTLIVPAHNDSFFVRYASAAHFDELLAAGVRIARFEGGLLHTKSLAIDGVIGILGSVNLDMRSLWLNFEISLFVYDEAFTTRLAALQKSYLERSDLLELEEWRRRPAWRKFTEDTLRLAGPLL